MRKLQKTEQSGPRSEHLPFEVRFTNKQGETEAWIVDGELFASIAPEMLHFSKAAYIDDSLDTRIGRQASIISRLLEHVKAHCPAYADPPSVCTYAIKACLEESHNHKEH